MASQKLPVISGSKLCKTLKKDGFQNHSQKGSHIKLKKYLDDGRVLTVIVPGHDKISKGLLLTIIKQAGHSKESFLKLL